MRCAVALICTLTLVDCRTADAAPGEAVEPGLRGCPIVNTAPAPAAAEEAPAGSLVVLAPKAEVDLAAGALFPNGIELHFGNRVLTAPVADYNRITGDFHVSGDVRFQEPGMLIRGTGATFISGYNRLELQGGGFDLFGVPARGSARNVAAEAGVLTLSDVFYTTCAPGGNDWRLVASSLRIDTDSGIATARNARLEFQSVPIFYTPWISYPIYGERQSGFLLPSFGRSTRRGFELDVPYYFNLAPNYDATLTTKLLSERGVQLVSEVRYLSTTHSGQLGGEVIPDDSPTGKTRYLVSWADRSLFGAGWRATVDAKDVSDKTYFEDLYGGLAATSQTHLDRRLDVEFANDTWSILARLQGYQTLDEILMPGEKPYARVPELRARANWPTGPLGLGMSLLSDLTYFQRDTSVNGARLHVAPELHWPLTYRGIRLDPAIELDFTRYALSGTGAGQPDSPARTVPVYSVDLSTAFERSSRHFGDWLQTVEPRLQYVNIPYRNQDALPVFDTIDPDFNLVQLFRKNRFAGYDRVGDTNQLNVGVTSRIIDATDGSQLVSATVGQSRYFGTRRVLLPGNTDQGGDASNYVAEVGFHIQSRWNVGLGYQWNTDIGASQLAEARLQYRQDAFRAINVAYRYRRDVLNVVDLSAAWPVSDHWSAIGRYEYSILENQSLEGFLGVEYQTCCWGLRLTLRRHLADREGNSDTSVSVQLVLKGLGNPLEPAERLLEHGILGYERD